MKNNSTLLYFLEKVTCFFCSFLLSLSLVSYVVADQSEAEKASELKDIRSRIKDVETRIKGAQDEAEKLQKELRKNEITTAETLTRLHDFELGISKKTR